MRFHLARDWRRDGRGTAAGRNRWRLRPTLLALEDRRLLSTFTVNNTGDNGSGSGLVGDLRYCITQANSAGGDETITFDSTVFGTPQTITLSGTQLELSDTTGTETITGPAGGVTVSGGGLSRVFQVDPNVTASISGLTITGGTTGSYGGGLYNLGTTSLTNCTVSGNYAGYGYGGGGLDTGSSSFPEGTTSLTNCTVSGNSASFNGGGVLAGYGTTTLTNTIVAGNSASVQGDVSGTVSGSFNLIGTGGSGGLSNGVDGNIVGVANPGLAPLGNYGGTCQTMALLPGSPAINAGTIGAGIPATDQRGLSRFGAVDIGAFESQGFIYEPVASSSPQTSPIGTAFANPLAVSVTANNPVEPVDGGVFTFVAQPAANGAKALFMSPSAVITNGQADITAVPNNVDGTYDVVGSIAGYSATFQLTNAGRVYSSLVVNTTSDSLAPGAGLLSLREAIAFNNSSPSGNASITFDRTVFRTATTITLTGPTLELSDATGIATITGPAAGVTVSGGGLGRVFQVDGGVNASLTRLTITGGATTGNGGGLYNLGTTTLTDCTISGNTADGSGGGLSNYNGTNTLIDCAISGNTSYGDGGGLNNSGIATLTGCTISGNTGYSDGGGVSNSGSIALKACIVNSNVNAYSGFGAEGRGGGLYNSGTATLANCTVRGNSSAAFLSGVGGGVANGSYSDSGATTTLTNCTVSGNYAGDGGGGISNYGTTTLTDCTISKNTARANQGGGLTNLGTATLYACTISGNSVGIGSGGGVSTGTFFHGSSTTTLNRCIISGNYASEHGGGVSSFGTTTLNGSTVAGNAAGIGGGGLFSSGSPLNDSPVGTLTLTNCTISGNQAPTGGGVYTRGGITYLGGVLEQEAVTILTNCTVKGNSSTHDGGGLFSSALGTTTETNTTVSGNTAANGGGVYTGGGVFHGKLYGATTLTDCTVSGNSATGNGGGLYNGSLGSTTLTGRGVEGNSAAVGGGIANKGTLKVDSGDIINNHATSKGGGISTTGGSATITSSTIISNQVNSSGTVQGGGIDCENSVLSLTNCTVVANEAIGAHAYGGGIYALNSTVDLGDCTVVGNQAIGSVTGEGGGIYSDGCVLTLVGTNIIGNKANTGGDNIVILP
jgi:fibronectin-binding autotransporter adhesin